MDCEGLYRVVGCEESRFVLRVSIDFCWPLNAEEKEGVVRTSEAVGMEEGRGEERIQAVADVACAECLPDRVCMSETALQTEHLMGTSSCSVEDC